MNIKQLVLACGLSAISIFSYGAEWAYIARDNQGNTIYVDKQSYKYDHNKHIATIWERSTRTSVVNKTSYVSSKGLLQFDCNSRKMRQLALIKYAYDGSILNSSDIPSPFTTIFPDTIGENLWESACKNKGKGLYFNPSTVRHIDDLKSRGVELKPFTPPKLMSLDELKASWSTETSTQQPQPERRFLTDEEIRQKLPHIDHPANRQSSGLPDLSNQPQIKF